MNDGVLADRKDGALWLTMNRPSRANALDPATVGALHEAFCEPGDARLIVLTGAGDRAFCSGADLAGDAPEATARQFSALLQVMDTCPVPIIARVNGAAAGGGVGLVCAADIAVGINTLSLATPDARVGLFPFMIMPYLLRVSGMRTVAQMIFAGRKLSADEAVTAGFLTSVVEAGALDAEVARISAAIAAMGPQAIRVGRAAYQRTALGEGPADERLMQDFIRLWDSEESKEGRAAFREKRAPAWQETAR
jgi:enoyl-CoA hydratase/carnithine racemase